MNKEQWIDDIMKSTNGMARATPEAGLQARINNRLATAATGKRVPVVNIGRWVAAAVLLLTVNVATAIYAEKHSTTDNKAALASQLLPSSTYNY